jgi:molybdopterin-guanine dinucleotide biosynthesis protein A
MNSSIHGIVLAGGQSLRMGTDKALLPVKGKPLIRHICDTLEKVCGELTVVLPFGEPNRYKDVLNHSVHAATDRFPNKGPLAGIHTGLLALNDEADYAFVMACDMPVFSMGLYERMLARVIDWHELAGSDEPRPEAVLCPGEPFHAFYHRSTANIAERLLRHDQRKLTAFIEALQSVYVLPESESCFLNLNTQTD